MAQRRAWSGGCRVGSIEGFDHDLFISYAHDDDRVAFGAGQLGFVSRLQRALDVLVGRRIDRRSRFNIWMDAKLRGNDFYDDEIADRIGKSATFIAVVSPAYLDSTYCLRELECFLDRARASRLGPRVGNKSRLFRVNFDVLRADQREPSALAGTGAHEFFERDRASENVSLLHEGDRYEKLVELLSRDIADLLEDMKRSASPPSPPGAGSAVYLAAVTDDLQPRRVELQEAFAQYGVRVLPDWSKPHASRPGLEEAVADALRESAISIHLVGASYGDHLFGDESNLSLSETQYGLALRAAGSGNLGVGAPQEIGGDPKPRVIVWVPPGVELTEVADERQKGFLRRIRNETAPQLEWLQQGIEDLKDLCFNSLGIVRRTTTEAPIEDGAMVFVACEAEARDYQDFKEIVGCLKSRGHSLLWPNWERSDALPEDRMRYSDGVLILYVNQTTPEWAEARAVEAMKLSKRRKQRPMVTAIYDGPPQDKAELPFEFRAVKMMPARTGFNETALLPFLEELGNRAVL